MSVPSVKSSLINLNDNLLNEVVKNLTFTEYSLCKRICTKFRAIECSGALDAQVFLNKAHGDNYRAVVGRVCTEIQRHSKSLTSLKINHLIYSKIVVFTIFVASPTQFPRLRSLAISFPKLKTAVDQPEKYESMLHIIGRSCPQLTSLSLEVEEELCDYHKDLTPIEDFEEHFPCLENIHLKLENLSPEWVSLLLKVKRVSLEVTKVFDKLPMLNGRLWRLEPNLYPTIMDAYLKVIRQCCRKRTDESSSNFSLRKILLDKSFLQSSRIAKLQEEYDVDIEFLS